MAAPHTYLELNILVFAATSSVEEKIDSSESICAMEIIAQGQPYFVARRTRCHNAITIFWYAVIVGIVVAKILCKCYRVVAFSVVTANPFADNVFDNKRRRLAIDGEREVDRRIAMYRHLLVFPIGEESGNILITTFIVSHDATVAVGDNIVIGRRQRLVVAVNNLHVQLVCHISRSKLSGRHSIIIFQH